MTAIMVGKRVRNAVYVHRSAAADLPTALQAQLAAAAARAPEAGWTVARLAPDHTGLMLYEPFDTVAFPALLEAWRIDSTSGALRFASHRASVNPLILHRKELLVCASEPGRDGWAALTAALVERGLFAQPHRIGRRQAWDARLAKAGLRVEGHALCPA